MVWRRYDEGMMKVCFIPLQNHSSFCNGMAKVRRRYDEVVAKLFKTITSTSRGMKKVRGRYDECMAKVWFILLQKYNSLLQWHDEGTTMYYEGMTKVWRFFGSCFEGTTKVWRKYDERTTRAWRRYDRVSRHFAEARRKYEEIWPICLCWVAMVQRTYDEGMTKIWRVPIRLFNLFWWCLERNPSLLYADLFDLLFFSPSAPLPGSAVLN